MNEFADRSFQENTEITVAAGEKKASLSLVNMILLSLLGGAFIAFAAEGSNMLAYSLLAKPETFGLGKCIAGLIFPAGLMLVVLAGAELFTGNALMVMALCRKSITINSMLRNWVIVYLGNFIGSLLIVYMIFYSGQLNSGAGLLGGITLKIASGKVSLSFLSALLLGILCNWLVCLAIWIASASRTIIGKIFSIFFPVWLFVASGFEHCIANMYYIPAGILCKGTELFVKASGLPQAAIDNLNWGTFIINNLIPVTLGNILGGFIFVALLYWKVYAEKV